MTTRAWRILGLVSLAAPVLVGQQGGVGGPVAGYVFDNSAQALRPILGIPGAWLVGDALSFGIGLKSAYVSPRQDLAVVVGADGSLRWFRLKSGAVSGLASNGITLVPQRVAFSPSGTAVALAAAGHVQVVTGLPDAPALAGAVDAGGTPDSLAISDDGTLLLFAASGSIRLVGTAGESRKLMDAADGALVAFAPGGHDAAVADPAGAGVVLFRDVAGASTQSLLALPDDGIAAPVGLVFSPGGRKLYLASSAARSVTVLDLPTAERTAAPCDCAPAVLVPMGNLLRMTDLGAGPLWLLDAGGRDARMVFVPAVSVQ
jgi:DNA-binding beta-propeller fold protein YncE